MNITAMINMFEDAAAELHCRLRRHTKATGLRQVNEPTVEISSDEVQEEEYVSPHIGKKMEQLEAVVVYNRFDIHSMMAAALYAGRYWYPKTQAIPYQLLDTTSVIHSDFSNYTWVGVDPEAGMAGFIHTTLKKGAIHNQHKAGPWNEDLHRPTTVFEETAEELGIVHESQEVRMIVHSLGSALSRFYQKDLTKAELIFVFRNYRLAKRAIETNTLFEPVPYSETIDIKDEAEFQLFIRRIKSKLKNQFKTAVARIDGNKHKYCLLSISFDDYCWAIRMVRMVYGYYLNVTSSHLGYAIDTNIHDLSNIKLIDEYVRLNRY